MNNVIRLHPGAKSSNRSFDRAARPSPPEEREHSIVFLMDVTNSTRIAENIGDVLSQKFFGSFFSSLAAQIRTVYGAKTIGYGGDSMTYSLPFSAENAQKAQQMAKDMIEGWDEFLEKSAPSLIGTKLKIAIESGTLLHQDIDGIPALLGKPLQSTANAFKNQPDKDQTHLILLGPDLCGTLGYPQPGPSNTNFINIYHPPQQTLASSEKLVLIR